MDGRLTLADFSERVGSVLRARTQADLRATLVDLPDVAAPERRAIDVLIVESCSKGKGRNK